MKLGDTVAVKIMQRYKIQTEWYFDEDGNPCDREGKPLWPWKVKLCILDTPAKVAAWNRKHAQISGV